MSANEAVERIIALRELTKNTGVVTRRAQQNLLASLDDVTLAEVAVKLNRIEKDNRNDSDPLHQ